ncbi:MAG: PAS domain-containing protein, partial [Agathobacter sp.]|nr:PAS domain-containing protein [Agathobacter sp.]
MDKELMKAAFKAMLESSTDMVFLKDANLVYQAASMPFVKMVGKSSEQEIIGHTDLEIFEDENLAKRYVADDHKLMEDGENLVDYMEPITDDNGHARYGSTSKFILRDNEGQLIGLLGITKDITREYFARQRYQQELKYLFKLPEDTYAVCYIDVDSWRVISQRRQEIGKGTLQVCQTVEELCQVAIDSIVNKQCDAAKFYRNFTAAKL